ncbi:hypothetical protein BCV72DRAFT_269300 [Rhizopus microsporus var. microsporus]|uniref:Reticulon-like protein n=2 Tax=Rhizopus microsporus TaxID=58291 RepID=A0A2G4ST36_RHIZD|nr:uncharacterized protein RHIMIDRAFT_314303 [Rhizopus microsporus ATCC 52813]XP_023465641.1 uncharacterized protein RHIMIDRAFT_292763 [Rhizopus microsporus ATCC 52813]ORE10057.1 hypothetical protein BCV72DRAFT_269300 [Rhizopus microsporus var. microsporus]PHZ11518.1 hypothetical protein RHIMIDRAFT_314303 [Rhizopus microsporus ATCC 52813]PHZ11933.1 hypothetical protein RHIMIDRAFT_292763 [Rhizopus microsporus ATCC 52813]
MADTEIPPTVNATEKVVESPVAPITSTSTSAAPASTEGVLATPPPSTTSTATSAPTTAPTTTTTNAPGPAAPTPTAAATKSTQNHSYTSPNIKFEDNPSGYLKAKIESLIYWEYPKKSATFLASTLGLLVLTQYYSVLQIVAGIFTLATGINWLYVNLHKQSQRIISNKSSQDIVNPHNHRLQVQKTYIPRERVLRAAHLTTDVAEVVTQHVTRLVLIEDNFRSLVAFIVSFFVWTLAKYVSTKYLVGFFIISAFTLPRLYLQNKELVDAHVARQSQNARQLAEQYGSVANQKAREIGCQVKDFIQKKTGKATASVNQDTKKSE